MAWETVYEKEQIEIRCDSSSKNIILEVNSGGFRSQYVTLHLSQNEVEELIKALHGAKDKVFGMK